MSATKAGKRPLRSLTAHEKLNAIKRVSVGGESKASVARDIGVPESTLRGWCKNQEKISYQVKTSPSNVVEDAPENISIIPAKRVKMEEQPYNLSLKSSDISTGSYSPRYSPESENNFETDYRKSSEPEPDNSPLNLRTNKPPAEPPLVITSTPKMSNNGPIAAEKEKVIEKNRAELTRLSTELGLNRPEAALSSSNINDLTTALMQWKSVYQTWFYQQQQKALQQQTKTPADTSGKMVSPNNGLLTTVDKRDKMLPNIEQQPSVYDSVSYWLRQQSLLGISTSTITSSTNTTTSAVSDLAASQNATNQQLRLWGWYQQSAFNAAQLQAAASVPPELQRDNQKILYQQLTKDPAEKGVNTENEMTKEEKPKNSNKNRSVLDNLLLNNNTIESSVQKEEVSSLDTQEAIEHGEKFLNWLEHCSDPAVTTLQLHTVQSLIKNLKNGIDRRNGDSQSRSKVRRK